MEDHRAIGRTAHARVGDPNHVLDALARELAGDRQIARFRHAGLAGGAGVLQYQKVLRRHVEIGGIDARRQVVERGEHHGAAGALEELRVGGSTLEDGALGGKRAEECDQPTGRL